MSNRTKPAPGEWSSWRLKDLARINPDALPEETPPDRAFRYVDISGVDGLGQITGFADMTFENAPSRARRLVASGDVILSTVRTYLRAIAKAPPNSADFVFSTGFLTVSSAKLANLSKQILAAIALLREYRTALISAAVTGQIDVRGTKA